MTKDELKKKIIELIGDFDGEPSSVLLGLTDSEGNNSAYVNGTYVELSFIINRIAAKDKDLKKIIIGGLMITDEMLEGYFGHA